jgi:leader peptidase (prepilin peptidase)/N-methyltransferase
MLSVMMIIIWIFVAIVGLCFGSLITLLSWRIPRNLPIGAVRSRCPSCQTALGARDLVPLFSWLFARGSCRHCHSSVHWRYPLTECFTALVFVGLFARYGISWEFLIFALLGVLLITMSIIDFEHYIIPDSLQWAMGLLAIVYHLAHAGTSPATLIANGLLGVSIGLIIKYGFLWIRKKDGLGMGDVKFLLVAGLWIAPVQMVLLLFMSGVLGVITGLVWRMLGHGERFPFGPALGLAMYLLILFPQITWYFWHIDQLIPN